MIIHKRNKPQLCIRDDLFSCRLAHDIHLRENKQVLQRTNSKMLSVNGILTVLQHSLAKPQYLDKSIF